MLFDVLKIYHFRTKRKIFYMYKLVVGEEMTPSGHRLLKVSHLDENQGWFWLSCENKVRPEIEIVQGFKNGYFNERARLKI